MTNIDGEEFKRMRCLAQEVLIDYGICKFPINVFSLAVKVGMELHPYSKLNRYKKEKLTQMDGTEKGFTVVKITANGGIVYDTFYNDIDLNEAACRFTIAHEIKHVVTGDCLKTETEFTETDEILADYFAKCLLAPQAVVLSYGLRYPDAYVKYFGLSYQAAKNWHSAVEKRKYKFGDEYLFDYEKEFLHGIAIARQN